MLNLLLPVSDIALLGFGVTSASILGSAYLYFGALDLSDRRSGDMWKLVVGVVLIWAAVGAVVDLPFVMRTLPIYWLRGGLVIWAGILILRLPAKFGPERFVPGIAFIADGLHLADFPFLAQVDSFEPWAYLIWPLLRLGFGVFVGQIIEELKYYVEHDSPHPRKLKAMEKAKLPASA